MLLWIPPPQYSEYILIKIYLKKEELDSLNKSRTTKEIKSVIKNLPTELEIVVHVYESQHSGDRGRMIKSSKAACFKKPKQ
jgi:hypothetical protein